MNESLVPTETALSPNNSLTLVTEIIERSLSVEVDNSESQYRGTVTLVCLLGKILSLLSIHSMGKVRIM